MRLGISSAVAPDADFDTLVRSCAHRGLATLELRVGDGHGLEGAGEEGGAADRAALRSRAIEAGVEVAGIRAESLEDGARMERLSASFEAPLLLAGAAPLRERIDRVRGCLRAGLPALVEVRGSASGWLDAVRDAGVGFAWTIARDTPDPVSDLETILRSGGAPDYLRMEGGGGPEAALDAGPEIGAIMGRLALERYAGPLILAPGSTRYRVAWSTWLGRRGGWGCGGKEENPGIVRLTTRIRGGTA